MMVELVRKMMLTGVGAAIVGKEKMEGFLGDFVNPGGRHRSEGGITGELMQRANKEYEMLGMRVRDGIQRNLRNTGLVTEADLKDMKQELYILRQRIAQLEHPKPEGE